MRERNVPMEEYNKGSRTVSAERGLEEKDTAGDRQRPAGLSWGGVSKRTVVDVESRCRVSKRRLVKQAAHHRPLLPGQPRKPAGVGEGWGG